VSGELTSADSIHFPDSLRYTTLGGKNRTVYGGGGIMPDIFVPIDSIYLNGVLGDLSYSGVVREYAFDYTDAHRKDLSKYKNAQDFVKKFVVTDAMIAELLKKASDKGIKAQASTLRKVTPELKNRLKAQIARHQFDDDAMFMVLLEADKDFKQAIDVTKNYAKYALAQ
jgi:carboxyl-terminal processing protease